MAQEMSECPKKPRISHKWYYIVYFKSFFHPKLYPVKFANRNAAKRAIRVSISKKNRAFYEVISGKKLGDFNFAFLLKLGSIKKFTKYEYDKSKDSPQKRKSQRTLARRRLRRMGMLTPVQNKQSVIGTTKYVKLIKNTQEVAKNPNTIAVAFQLERKNKRLYYVILKKYQSPKKGILFKIRALRINMKTKAMKVVWIQIYNIDVIKPILFTEILQIYGNRLPLDRCREEGLRLDYWKQKTLLKRVLKTLPDTTNP